MKKKTWILSLVLAAGSAAALQASAQAVVGQPAPAFTAVDAAGKPHSLAEFKGKHVVLEWVNPGCPYVQKHYNSGNMPATQKLAASKGVTWLAISSTAKDASDYRTPADLAAWIKGKEGAPAATLIDADGKIGRAYGARTTPHMYLVDPQGMLVYAGAIDSKPTANPADIASATNYVSQAIGEVLAGKAVSQPVTRAYGCSIKYADAG
jgi:peroxiredoxin